MDNYINYLNYLSDAVVECKIVKKNGTDKMDLQIVYTNKQIEYITNTPAENIINNNLTEIFPGLNDSIFDWPKIIIEAAATNKNKIIEQYIVAFDKYLRLNIFGYDGEYFFIVITDITEKRERKRQMLEKDRQIRHLEEQIKARANVDMLTNLYNFQFIIESFQNSIETYKEEGITFCVLLIDIDDIKKINETYGFATGNAIIKDISHIFSSVARKIDVAGRYGNDKFIMILNNMDIDIAKIMVERLKQDISKMSMTLGNTKITVCGALMEYNGEPMEKFLNNLEKMTIKAQTLGKGNIIS